jgi:hypothetical protein
MFYVCDQPRNPATQPPQNPLLCSFEIHSQLPPHARYCRRDHHLSRLHDHQASRAWAPGVIHVQVISFSRPTISPFSLAAKNVSSRTVTVSSFCLASVDSDCGKATKVRVFFAVAWGGAMVSFRQQYSCSERMRIRLGSVCRETTD